MTYLPARTLVLLCSVLILAGCSTFRPGLSGTAVEQPLGYRVGDIVDTQSGLTLKVDSLMEELSRAKVVYVGETHTSIEDHRIQLEILKRLYERNPSIVLAMEMFPTDAQPVLDRFSTGAVTEEEFLKEVKWSKIWGYPFRLYRPIMTLVESKHIRIIGINAPGEIVAKVARNGVASLTADERARIARDFHSDDPLNRLRIRQEYDQHLKGDIKDFDAFYEAQLTWEETMAQTLAETLGKLPQNGQIVVLIGKGHMPDRLGVPVLTSKRAPNAFSTVAPVPFDYPESIADPGIADFVWVTDKPENPHKGGLGLMARALSTGEGIEIAGVIPGSPAEKAGFLKGDVIFMIDETPVRNVDDLHTAVAGEPGKVHSFHVKRGKKRLSLPVTLSP